jgi:hypothetical protein
VTAVPSPQATREERRRAYPRVEAVRIARAVGLRALVPALETGALLLLRGWGWTRARERAPLRALAPRPAPPRGVGPRTFDLVLVERGSGRPLEGVALEVVTPDGDQRRLATDGDGRARLDGLLPGVCSVSSVLDGARAEGSFTPCAGVHRVGGAPPIHAGHLVEVERHRVRTGETPETLAAAHGLPWERIAAFNWGTADPEALERSFALTLGCTRRTPEGRLRFDDGDDPGIILVPRPWTARLSVGAAHEIVVAPLRPLFLRLENDAGLPLPGARYTARFADGGERSGLLGNRGIARLDGVPEGPFTVSYPDEETLLATSLAASVRWALEQGATAPLFTLLMQSAEVVAGATAIYARHFDDLTGRGLAADIDQVVTDADARRPLRALCQIAGVEVA